MKVELHLHTSRYSACATAGPSEMAERLVQAGYEAVYITEHDAVWSEMEIAQLQAGFPEIRIFPGVELSLGDEFTRHLLVLGTSDPEYVRLRREAEVLGKARAEGHLTVLAHPFRWPGGPEMLEAGLLPDAIEYRAGNQPHPDQAALAEAAAAKYGLALVNAGDTHGPASLGRYWIETDRPLQHPRDIRAVVLNDQYVNWIADR